MTTAVARPTIVTEDRAQHRDAPRIDRLGGPQPVGDRDDLRHCVAHLLVGRRDLCARVAWLGALDQQLERARQRVAAARQLRRSSSAVTVDEDRPRRSMIETRTRVFAGRCASAIVRHRLRANILRLRALVSCRPRSASSSFCTRVHSFGKRTCEFRAVKGGTASAPQRVRPTTGSVIGTRIEGHAVGPGATWIHRFRHLTAPENWGASWPHPVARYWGTGEPPPFTFLSLDRPS